jgi:putative flippase GtrA
VYTFLKANISSILASLGDYCITVVAVAFFGMPVVTAAITGTTGGAVLNFFIGRYWVFIKRQESSYTQAGRYLQVWCGNLVLNTAGVYVLAQLAGVHYLFAKVAVSILVAVCYNYPLQKNYVFKQIPKL